MKERIIIAGGSGFLGRPLAEMWSQEGKEVLVLSRNPRPRHGYQEVDWDGRSLGPWAEHLDGAKALVNLAGRSVDCRYNARNKTEIVSSRIDSTRILQEAVAGCTQPPPVWINASTATIYRHAEDRAMTERNGEIGSDFSMDVAKAWEAEFFNRSIPRVRKVAARTSIVLGAGGGAFPKMRQITRLGLGGRQGDGRQMVSWIHIRDFFRAIDFLLQNEQMNGAVNVTAPDPLPNNLFNRTLRNALGVSIGIPSPVWLLEVGAFFMRTETELLLKSRWALPDRLQEAGFRFEYGSLESALSDLCNAH